MAHYDFTNRTLVLTGANGGIGREVARIFYDGGANLFLIDRERGPLDALALELGGNAARIRTLGIDAADPDAASLAAREIEAAFAHVDFLVPAAGIYLAEPFAEMTDEQWRRTLSINLDGVFYLTRRLLPLLRDGGAIVNVSSMAAHRGAFYNAHYSASKGALLSLTRSLARELGPRIRVNAVSPGLIETPMTTDLLKHRGAQSLEQTILGRFGAPREVASVIAFLCSDDASFMTAEVLHVNGGLYVAG
jgi:3-oxoacyl-[acyl-carrier protein] reductase